MDPDDKAKLRRDAPASDPVWSALSSPIRLSLDLFIRGLRLLRPISPQLIPVAVCLLLIPAVVLLSFSAGWVVWRSVAVGWESQIYLNYGDGTAPYAQVSLPLLVAKQPYDISLHLTVPATESNLALGNFMTSLTLSTPSNKTLTSVRRSAIAIPPTRSLSFLSSRPTAIHLDVPLLFSYAPGTSRVVAKIELGRRDGWRSIGNGQGRELSVFSASLRGAIKHYGIRGLVTRFPLIFSLISSVTFLVISLLVLIACLLPAIEWRLYRDSPLDVDGPDAKGNVKLRPFSPNDESGDERPLRRRRKSRGRRNRSTDGEVEAQPISPAAGPSTVSPLRRRRSVLSSDRSIEE